MLSLCSSIQETGSCESVAFMEGRKIGSCGMLLIEHYVNPMVITKRFGVPCRGADGSQPRFTDLEACFVKTLKMLSSARTQQQGL